MTGAEIYQDFRQRIDQAYNTYVDPAKANRLLKNTLIKACEKKYVGLSTQKQFDEIRHMITTRQSFVPVRNRLQLKPLMVTSITGAGPTLTVTTHMPHHVAAGDTVFFQGVAGITSTPAINDAAGFQVASVTSPTSFTITVTAAAGAHNANTGSMRGQNLVTDYGHLFSLKASFEAEIPNLTLVRLENTTPTPLLYLSEDNNIRTGERIKITGSVPTYLNATWYVRKVAPRKIELYSDRNRTQPLPVQVRDLTQVGGAIIRFHEKHATTYFSDRKIDDFNQPGLDNIKIETADNSLIIYPDDHDCTGVEVDYFKIPTVFIDVNDNVIDYTLTYPHKFLDSILDQAAAYFGGPAKDRMLTQDLTREIIENP